MSGDPIVRDLPGSPENVLDTGRVSVSKGNRRLVCLSQRYTIINKL
jgi:hypothetical protein